MPYSWIVDLIELGFMVLLVIVALMIVGFAGLVLYKLFEGQD